MFRPDSSQQKPTQADVRKLAQHASGADKILAKPDKRCYDNRIIESKQE